MVDLPPILVAHRARFVREAIAAALRDERPGDDIRAIAVDELDEALLARPSVPIVITSDATRLLQTAARAWILLAAGDGASVAGVGNATRVLAEPGIAGIAAALDVLIRETSLRQAVARRAARPVDSATKG